MLRGDGPLSRAGCSGGFTYIGLLIAIAILGIMLSAVGTLWSFSSKRDKEVELLFIGHEFRNAITRYYTAGGRYPPDLGDLVNDDRAPVPRHFLRQIYPDPMTGAADWQLILAPDGGVMGVASSSKAATIKRANFDLADTGLENSEHYGDWQFIYLPTRNRRLPAQIPR